MRKRKLVAGTRTIIQMQAPRGALFRNAARALAPLDLHSVDHLGGRRTHSFGAKITLL